jgi:hypothetical protein
MHPDLNMEGMFGPSIPRGSWKSGAWARRGAAESNPLQDPAPGPKKVTGKLAMHSGALSTIPPLFPPPNLTDPARPSARFQYRSDTFTSRQTTPPTEDEDEMYGHFPDFRYDPDPDTKEHVQDLFAPGSTSAQHPPAPKPLTLRHRRSAPSMSNYDRGTYFAPVESESGSFDPNARFFGETAGSRLLMIIRDWKQEYLAARPQEDAQGPPHMKNENEELRLTDEPVTITNGGIVIRNELWQVQPVSLALLEPEPFFTDERLDSGKFL